MVDTSSPKGQVSTNSDQLHLEKLAAGETIDQLLEAHPRLSKEDILAALSFAAEALRAGVVYPIPEHGT